MRFNFIYILLMLCVICNAQQTAFWETDIFIEDAIGNKDTITIGNDPEANFIYNPALGEIDIAEPWDSVFEIRGAHYGDFDTNMDDLVLSKKIIAYTEQNGFIEQHNCYVGHEPIILFVQSKHLPITVSWDTKVFKENWCKVRTSITNNIWPLAVQYWEDFVEMGVDAACMGEDSTYSTSTFDHGQLGFFLIDEIEGSGFDTLGALLIGFTQATWPFTPCTAVYTSTMEITQQPPIVLYPNPTFGSLSVNVSDFYEYRVFDLFGNLVHSGNEKVIDIGFLPCGMYMVEIFSEHFRHVEKVIKIK